MVDSQCDRVVSVGLGVAVEAELERVTGAAVGFGVGSQHHGRERPLRVGRVELADGHGVLGQGAGLVCGDDGDRPQGFDCGELAHDRLAVTHAFGSQRQRQRQHRGQTLGNRGDRDRDREQQRFVEVVDAFDTDTADGQHHRKHGDPAGDAVPEVFHPSLERGFLRDDGAQHGGDTAHRRFRAGAGDLDPAQPPHREGPRVRLVPGGPLDRNRLPGQHRLVDLQGLLACQHPVGGDAVAGFDTHEIAGNQQGRIDLGQMIITHDPHPRRRQFLQPLQGVLGPVLLPHPHHGVEHQNRRNGQRLERPLTGALCDPHHDIERQREQQDVDDRTPQLAHHPRPPRNRCGRRQRVRPMGLQERPSLRAGQTCWIHP